MSHARRRIDWTIPGFRTLLDGLGVSIVDGAVTVPFDLGPDPQHVELAAIGWATVELDRAETDLGAELATTFEPAGRDALLGATVRRSTGGQPQILILEPDTEGRLAGALARQGEGPVALYLRLPGLDEIPAQLETGPGTGLFGPARLVLNGPPAGPFIILVGQRAPGRADRVPSGA
jgi:hypothetical protein